ncbi:unnamed protein product [Phytophthora fragariaefolia]|uniref:Unnamed protein product n=1 Tax=Phytophthora fragariaefolia TaxID=1490495 RepID=A0A9W7CZN9_9STRA|nr:unnamed protein product [Phytophthora fragariaefolia]
MAAAGAIYGVGDRVDGLYDENTDDMWYPGRIRRVHLGEAETGGAENPTFEVLYDDGEVEMHVSPDYLRHHIPGTICVGTRVLCRYDGGEEYYPGQVSDVQENGRYTIAYDDGETEEDVPLDHILEPKEEGEAEATNSADEEEREQEQERVSKQSVDDAASDSDEQQRDEEDDVGGGDSHNSPSNTTDEAFNAAGVPQENKESAGDGKSDELVANESLLNQLRSKQPTHDEVFNSTHGNEDPSNPIPEGVSSERAYIIESLQLLEKRLGDASSTKSVLSTFVKQMRAYPQVTADLVHERGGERLVIDALKFHQSHAVIQCYGFVLLRRLCFLCVKSTHYLLRNGIVELVTQAMTAFAEDAILQASACGALAVFTRVHAGLNVLIEYQAAQLVLSTLIYHKTYSVHTRQVHYYACEGLNGLAELSTVMARYPAEPSIQKYSAPASKQIALCSVRQSPTKRIKDTASEILREAETLEHTPTDRHPKKSTIRGRSTNIGKRKTNLTTGHGASPYPRGAAYTSGTPFRNAQAFSKVSSPYTQGASGFGSDMSTFGYSGRDFPGATTAPQQPSSLVILDGSIGVDNGLGSTNKRKLLSKEDRQSELFDAYGIQGIPNSANGRPYGTKRAQLRAHLASAESAWASPQLQGLSASKPYSSRSEHLEHAPAYSHRENVSNRQNRWECDNDEPQHMAYEPELKHSRGAKRKKKNPVPRTAFQVKLENENQLRVSREARSPYPSPQRLGAATKRAAKARQKRISTGAYSSLTGRSNDTSSESLNDYATQLFHDNISRAGTSFPSSSKLTPREKEEIRERERLSFAEKLHKMIDKAKSTLANGNTTTVPSADHSIRQHKSSASSKAARKIREASSMPSDEKRPLSKKSRPTASSTSKQATKDMLSPRESIETRPAKPTSGAPKRQVTPSDEQQNRSAQQASVAPRVKPMVSRSTVTPKTITEQKVRSTVKSNKAVTPKSVDINVAEGGKEILATVAPAKVIPSTTSPTDAPLHEDSDATVLSPDTASEVLLPTFKQPTQQVETEAPTSTKDVSMEVDDVQSNIPPEQKDASSSSETNTQEIPGQGITAEEVEPALSEAEIVNDPVDAPLPSQADCRRENASGVTVDTEVELPKPSIDSTQTKVSPLEEPPAVPESAESQPGGGSAAVDAMYGDAYNEFDDNGGDDEVDTDDMPAAATATLDPKTDIPLQESKSGEALYDDGYDEFDEDVASNPEKADMGDTPIEADDTEGERTVPSSEPIGIACDPATSGAETESENVSVENGLSLVTPVESTSNEGDNREEEIKVQDGTLDDKADDIGVETPESDYVMNEPGESQEPQSKISNSLEGCVRDPDAPVGNVEEEHYDSNATGSEEKSEPDPSRENNLENGGEHEPVDTAVEDNADDNGILDGVMNAGNYDSGAETDVEFRSEAVIPMNEPIMTDNVVESAESSTQPTVSADGIGLPGESTDIVDPTSAETLPEADQPQQEEGGTTEAAASIEDNADVPSLESDEEEAKKLCEDCSVVSIQSAAYDEENFDDEETHQEEPAQELANEDNAVDAPTTEDASEFVGQVQQLDEVKCPDAPVDAEAPKDLISDVNRDEESKGLRANSSEVSVQSVEYDDDDFNDGAHEELPQENHTDDTESSSIIWQGGDRDADVGELNVLPQNGVDEVPMASDEGDEEAVEVDIHGDNHANEDFNSAGPVELRDVASTKVLETEKLQSLELKESSSASESEGAAESPAVEHDASMMRQDEPSDGASKYDENNEENLGEVANESDLKPADVALDSLVEECNSTEIAAAPSTSNDTFDSESSEITVPTSGIQQEGVAGISTQPAKYDDDDFDNDIEKEEMRPSLAETNSGFVPDDQQDEEHKNDVPDIQTPSTQTSDDVGDSAISEANNIGNLAEIMATPAEPELQKAEQLLVEHELRLPAMDDLALEVKPELEPRNVDDLAAADDRPGGSHAVEVATLEPDIVTVYDGEIQYPSRYEQGNEEDSAISAPDNSDCVVFDSNVDISPAEKVQNWKSQPSDLVEPNVVEADALEDESKPDVGITAEDVAAEEVSEYAHDDDKFDESPPESDPAPADAAAVSDNSMLEEEQSAGVALNGNAIALDGVITDNALSEKDADQIDENVAVDSVGKEISLPAQSKENPGTVGPVAEVSGDVNDVEATTNPLYEDMKVTQDSGEPSEARADSSEGDNILENDHNIGALKPGAADDAFDNPDDEAANGSNLDYPPLRSPQDEFRPEKVFDSHEDEISSQVNSSGADLGTPVIESAASDMIDEPTQPAGDVDVAPDLPLRDEIYDEGFDEDTTASVADLSEPAGLASANIEDCNASSEGTPEGHTQSIEPADTDAAESDSSLKEQHVSDACDPYGAGIIVQNDLELEAKPEDTFSSDEVEPTGTPIGSEAAETGAEESASAMPETTATGFVEVATEADGYILKDISMESDVAEPVVVGSDTIEMEAIASKAAEPEMVEPHAVESEPDAIEPQVIEAEAGESPMLSSPRLKKQKLEK